MDIPKWEEFNKFFKSFCIQNLEKKLSNNPEIYEICVYPFTTGGKFFRSFLLYQTADFIIQKLSKDVKLESFLPLAFSIELIHNYSLIHDDLPSMDNSDYRRGYPTVHKKFGEAEAVLAGDMLLTLAFEYIANSKFEPEKLIRVLKKVSQYSSYRYLITGQFLDIWMQKGRLIKNLENIKIINFYKTSGLILLSVEIPVILLNPPYEIKYNLVRYGYFLGSLFQITDDILDYDGLYEVLNIKDLKNLAKNIYEKIMKIPVNQDLKDIANFVYNRNK